MRRLALLVLFAFPSLTFGQKLTLPEKVHGDTGAFVKVPATTDCKEVRWLPLDKGLNVFPVELLKDSKTAVVSSATAGTYRLMAYGAKGDVPTDPVVCVVVIGNAPPDPGPGPGPGPTPTPGPTALQVLILFESSELTKLPAAQLAALYNAGVRSYLESHCTKTGAQADYRIWDKDVDASNEGGRWPDLLKRAKEKPGFATPWLTVVDGKSGAYLYEAKLPATAADTLDLLKKYGGGTGNGRDHH